MARNEKKGFLKTWKDDRGFGFIKPEDGSDDIFIHISALKDGGRRPYRGDTIFYQEEHGNDGKSKAVEAWIEGVELKVADTTSSKKWIWLSVVFLVVVSIATVVFFNMT